MTLQKLLESHREAVLTVVALIARGDDVEFAAVGEDTRESVFPIASVTKPIVATAAMLLVQDGRIALDDPIANWLPELADPVSRERRTARSTTSSPRRNRSPSGTCSRSVPAGASPRISRCPPRGSSYV